MLTYELMDPQFSEQVGCQFFAFPTLPVVQVYVELFTIIVPLLVFPLESFIVVPVPSSKVHSPPKIESPYPRGASPSFLPFSQTVAKVPPSVPTTSFLPPSLY